MPLWPELPFLARYGWSLPQRQISAIMASLTKVRQKPQVAPPVDENRNNDYALDSAFSTCDIIHVQHLCVATL